MGAQKNRLNETVYLSNQNIMLKPMGKKINAKTLCLSKPVLDEEFYSKINLLIIPWTGIYLLSNDTVQCSPLMIHLIVI